MPLSKEQKFQRLISEGATNVEAARKLYNRLNRLMRRYEREQGEGGVTPGTANPLSDPFQNMQWVWVAGRFTALDTQTMFAHNLNIPLRADGVPNVSYFMSTVMHDGTGVVGTSVLSINYDTRDAAAITPMAFPLRLYSAAGRTVAVAHPVDVLAVFFGR